jgi:hypothetical protein
MEWAASQLTIVKMCLVLSNDLCWMDVGSEAYPLSGFSLISKRQVDSDLYSDVTG